MRTRLVPYFSLLVAATLAAAACGPKKASGAGAVSVSEIDLGRSLKPDLKIDDNTDTFHPADVVYLSVETKGSGPATLATRWTFQDNQVVNESSRTISPTGNQPARTEFHVSKPEGLPAGKYHVVVMLNGTTAGEKDFEVK
jgi:ribosomal protein L3